MTLGTHGQGFLGFAFEAVYGTYVPPTRFVPIKSETLTEAFANQKRRVIRGIADELGVVAGFSHVEGDITMELMSDILPYFMYVSRMDVVKSGAGPYIYVGTPQHWGASSSLPVGKKGLSITVVKNGEVFAFVGCVVSAFEIGVDTGIPHYKVTIVGRAEAVQTLPVPAWITTDIPFGAGLYSIEVPTAAVVFDVADFSFSCNDNAEAQNRLMNSRYAQWVKFGARDVTLQMTRDFNTRAEFDAFKSLTAQSVTVSMTKSVTDLVSIVMTKATMDAYTVDGLSDQGSPTQYKVTYDGVYDPAVSAPFTLTAKCLTTII